MGEILKIRKDGSSNVTKENIERMDEAVEYLKKVFEKDPYRNKESAK